ncbi:MAG: excinuclease ABC subunit UvrA [Tannerellaceae bacterium]|jgi:excinuclease ABC subunit A|nr:excinuclease ABC subunit UvrA [Tannerellaceae bacterium]
MENDGSIHVKGGRVNNLKSIDVDIPRGMMVVITGLSGSGKSSLAFDTLYAEGQRRYVESLSAYARQFLGRINKPQCDYITGIPPAIAIEQKVNTYNTRSSVGTATEIYEYLRLLYARAGKTFSPVSGVEVKKHSVNDVVDKALSLPQGTRFSISCPVEAPDGEALRAKLEDLHRKGFSRILSADEEIRLDTLTAGGEDVAGPVELLVDRLAASSDKAMRARLADSAETAFAEGGGYCLMRVYGTEGVEKFRFSKYFEADNITFEEPTVKMFNYNSPVGACKQCGGLGYVMGVDENLVVPDKNLSIYEGAVACWRSETTEYWLRDFIEGSEKYGFPIHCSYHELTEEQLILLWDGKRNLRGINNFFRYVSENVDKVQFRVIVARYRGKTTCPVCGGGRLKPEAMNVLVGGKDISELSNMSMERLKLFFDNLKLDETDSLVSKRILMEIRNRVTLLLDVGLAYLTLDRPSSTLSGGESQRINLVTSLGSSLVGSLYILDEPSVGLHSRDTDLLVRVLRRLKDLGNTVVIVEHDEDIIRSADYIIDIGPLAGRHGGEVSYAGDLSGIKTGTDNLTVRYLTGEERIELPEYRRKWNNYVSVNGARRNNLKGIDVKFPLNVMTVVTGVSGSGKSTLVRDILYEAMRRLLDSVQQSTPAPSPLSGDVRLIRAVEFVNQQSIGKSARSNPAIYIGAYDEIRKLFADQMLAQQLGFSPAYFSFNKEGGRCEECKGEGFVTVEMQFMADLAIPCDVCHGKRFRSDILEVEYRGYNIYDILEMTVDRAIEFMAESKGNYAKRTVKRLEALKAVGLGYIKLGQPSTTLSGGENQRVKLAYYLAQEKQQPTLFIFDEPTTGLHVHDIKTLLKAFDALISDGHTVVIIEHNMEIIKCADHIIDLGPEGGDKGGMLVCSGTPEEVSLCETSYTGRFLRRKLSVGRHMRESVEEV